ncbi:MAG TPA: DUF1264 domain-containing protein [Longimicrobiales bacterium]
MRQSIERVRNGGAGVVLVAALAVALVMVRAWAPSRASAVPAQEREVADPLRQYTTHIVATHYLRDEAYETHHYFKPLRDGVLQGLVFRRAVDGAPLIEVEWAISGDVFARLPDWQKAYWHPLAPAVDAGRVRLPDLPAAEEREMLATVRGLYAQTINLAGLDGALPIGLEGIALATHLTRAEMLRAMGAPAGR